MKKTKRITSFILVIVIIAGVLPTTATTSAEDTYSPITIQNFNGHTYAVYDIGMTWHEAKAYCESLGGHLVTITSQEEQGFIESIIKNGKQNQYWLGATDEAHESIWAWITGEVWSYTNWADTQPDNYKEIEHYLQMYRVSDQSQNTLGKWNDISVDNTLVTDTKKFLTSLIGFICEWDYIKDLKTATQNFNGHTYTVYDIGMTWHEAKAYCESLGGHLVTITSQAEQSFAESIVVSGNNGMYWIGATDKEQEGVWEWITGEKWKYANWAPRRPDNEYHDGVEGQDYLIICKAQGDREYYKDWLWDDLHYSVWGVSSKPNPNLSDLNFWKLGNVGFICEWDYIYSPTVGASSWAQADIDRARALGLLPASLDSKYQQNITRVEFCELAVKLYEKIKGELRLSFSGKLSKPMPTISGKSFMFTDTTNQDVYKMAYLDVVTGKGNDKFYPNDEITRQEAAVMLGRLMEALDCYIPDKAPNFTDVSSTKDLWSYGYIGKLQSLGIMGGISSNIMLGDKFDPLGKYTREQSIVTIIRIWDLIDGASASWIAPLTQKEYENAFSDDGNKYDWRFAYWAALASFDTYKESDKDSGRAMEHLGFKNVQTLTFDKLFKDEAIKAVYSLKELSVDIRGKNKVIMIAFRGTNNFRNIYDDGKIVPVDWYFQSEEYYKLYDEYEKAYDKYMESKIVSDFPTKPTVPHQVHRGFFQYADEFIKHDLKSKIGIFNYNDIDSFSLNDCLFIIVGHSLGGAIAELYSLYLSEIGVNINDIICYGVASPPNCTDKMQQYYFDKGMGNRIHKLYCTNDRTPTAGYNANSLAGYPEKFSIPNVKGTDWTKYHFPPTYLPYIMQKLK